MWSLGQSPIILPGLAGFYPLPTSLFGPGELAYMQAIIDQTGEDNQKRIFDGLERQVASLRLEDSVNAKLAVYAINLLKGLLSEETERLDADFPDTAPHSILLGPSFPQDARDMPIAGVVASVFGSRVVDDRGLFSDPHWSSVPPADRLEGHTFRILSGSSSGEDRAILQHRISGPSSPCIILDDMAGVTGGVKFKVVGISLPQDNLDRKDRSTDWAISTAIIDTFDGPNTSPLIRSEYWTTATNLKGRDLIWNGSSYRITAHTLGASVEISGSPAVGLDQFRIKAKSPFENGRMSSGSIRRGESSNYDQVEPNTKIRVTPRNLGGRPAAAGIRKAQDMIDRYLHLRYQKYFGSHPRLRRFRKTAIMINRQWRQQQKRRDDIISVAEDLNLPIRVEPGVTAQG